MVTLDGDRERIAEPDHLQGYPRPQVSRLIGFDFDRLTEAQVVDHVIRAAQAGQGGWVVTPNIDICRNVLRDPAHRGLVTSASLRVPDGVPLLWAARLRGDPLVERVAGASLIFTLTEAAAQQGRSIYLLGGKPGVPDRAGERLRDKYPGLIVAGTYSPPFGFETAADGVETVRRRLEAAAPDIVYVGLGFPKQERLIAELVPSFPATWFVACGAAIPIAAGVTRRAPRWMQHSGLEWMFRLFREPRRLFRRYMIQDLPFAAGLLVSSLAERVRPPN